MRRKHEANRRESLFKTGNYFQYIINYAGPTRRPLNHQTYPNQTTSLFLPPVSQLATHRTISTEFGGHSVKTSIQNEGQAGSPAVANLGEQKRVQRSMIREGPRPVKKQEVANINELVAKSMTPSARSSKTSQSNKFRTTMDTLNITCHANKKVERSKARSLSLRTYIGNSWYLNPRKRPSQLEVSKPRKQSICAWDVDSSPM